MKRDTLRIEVAKILKACAWYPDDSERSYKLWCEQTFDYTHKAECIKDAIASYIVNTCELHSLKFYRVWIRQLYKVIYGANPSESKYAAVYCFDMIYAEPKELCTAFVEAVKEMKLEPELYPE